jgi:hypothetical protein
MHRPSGEVLHEDVRATAELLGFFRTPLVFPELREEREVEATDVKGVEGKSDEVGGGAAKGGLRIFKTPGEAIRLAETAESRGEKRGSRGGWVKPRIHLLGDKDGIAGECRGALRVRASARARSDDERTRDVPGLLSRNLSQAPEESRLVWRAQQPIDEVGRKATPLGVAGVEVGRLVIVVVGIHRLWFSGAGGAARIGSSRAA